ncbi:MAG: hypothetical protein JWN25_1962 [Verrucomicrobiales bacterium]|nr:hypothetical protein [Verrucomicrobiales bacterium]
MNRLPGMFLCALLLSNLSSMAQMTAADVTLIIRQAATRAKVVSKNSIIAVVDREGYVLGVWSTGPVPASPVVRDAKVATAISKAGTAAFLSSDGEALTSRTAGFIVQQHFPPGVANKPPGPLVGVNFSNLPFSDINHLKNPATFQFGPGGLTGEGGINGASIPGSSLGGTPGGVPLYKNGHCVGGVGVTGDGTETIQVFQIADKDEDIALAGQLGFAPIIDILGSHVFIDGIRLPYVNTATLLLFPSPLASLGTAIAAFPITSSPPVLYPSVAFGKSLVEVRNPIRSDSITTPINGQPRLSAFEVSQILTLAAEKARTTRAGIRLPKGKAAEVFITVVSNPGIPGAAPEVLGAIRTPDATIFSWDVAVQKARTAIFFSNNQRAFSSRTVGFLAQSAFPPGIANTAPGPFLGLQERYSGFAGYNTLNGAFVPKASAPNPNLPNGITIFPGGFPLYRNGILIGAIGVSGDGIDQDDLIAAAGTVNYLPPNSIRADFSAYRGARLPYAKFPRDPEL